MTLRLPEDLYVSDGEEERAPWLRSVGTNEKNEEEEQEEERERQAAQAPAAGSSEVTADPGIGVENDWSLNGFDWGAIPADPSGVVGEIFSEGAERLLSA